MAGIGLLPQAACVQAGAQNSLQYHECKHETTLFYKGTLHCTIHRSLILLARGLKTCI